MLLLCMRVADGLSALNLDAVSLPVGTYNREGGQEGPHRVVDTFLFALSMLTIVFKKLTMQHSRATSSVHVCMCECVGVCV